MRLIDLCPSPRFIVWDITYACRLRCAHCYSESGRRPSKQLCADDLYRVTDALISMQPTAIVLSGGEPLLVEEIFEIAARMSNAGVGAFLYTSGWDVDAAMVPRITSLLARVTVSVDGATAAVHDRIRGRAGSFDRAMTALAWIDRAIGERRARGEPVPDLGIDFVVMRSNFEQLREFCATIAPRFPELQYISFGAVIPTGLASRISFGDEELLSEEQATLLAEDRLSRQLQDLAPASVEVSTTDNRRFQMHPDRLATDMEIPAMQVEPDGRVRAMPVYEGTVGSLLTEPPSVLWQRAMERWSDPCVVETLTPATTMQGWASATRRLDLLFGSAADRARIARRPPYTRA